MDGSQAARMAKASAGSSAGTSRSRFRLRRRWWVLAALLGVVAVRWLVPSPPTPREEQLAGLWERRETINGVKTHQLYLLDRNRVAHSPGVWVYDENGEIQTAGWSQRWKWKANSNQISVMAPFQDFTELSILERATNLYYHLRDCFTYQHELSVPRDDLMVWTGRDRSGRTVYQETFHRVTDPERRERLESQLRWGGPRDLDVMSIMTSPSEQLRGRMDAGISVGAAGFPVETISAELPAGLIAPVLPLGAIPPDTPLERISAEYPADADLHSFFPDGSTNVEAGNKIIR